MFEVEQKYRVDAPETLIDRLAQLNAETGETEHHQDTYFNHPARDFVETREALRVRRINGTPMITYKGPKLAGAIKAREELEWRLDPGDEDGSKTESLLEVLGFRKVATVRKTRQTYQFGDPWLGMTVVLDDVEQVGTYSEIETIVGNRDAVEAGRSKIIALSSELGLVESESRSYLSMLVGTL